MSNAAVATQILADVCFFSMNMGVSFKGDDPIAQNPALVEYVETQKPEDVVNQDGLLCIPMDTKNLGHFLHLLYCNVPNGRKVRVELDGIFPFDAPDESGASRRFNCQLLTISEVAE